MHVRCDGWGWPKHPQIQHMIETTAFELSLEIAFDMALDLGAIAEHNVFTAGLKVPITFGTSTCDIQSVSITGSTGAIHTRAFKLSPSCPSRPGSNTNVGGDATLDANLHLAHSRINSLERRCMSSAFNISFSNSGESTTMLGDSPGELGATPAAGGGGAGDEVRLLGEPPEAPRGVELGVAPARGPRNDEPPDAMATTSRTTKAKAMHLS